VKDRIDGLARLHGDALALRSPFGTGKADRKNLFVVNFAIFSATPTPALLKVAVGEPGLPLP
jgi:hypothetical protein